MATTSLNFSLPDCFLSIEDTLAAFISATFDIQIEGETVQIEAALFPCGDYTDGYYLCFHSPKDPFIRTESDIYVPSRGKRPMLYNSKQADLKSRVERLVEMGTQRLIFLVDTGEGGGTGLYWLYLSNDVRSGTWLSNESSSKWMCFDVEPHFPDFVAALADPESDIRFVLRWMELPTEIQRSLNTFYTNGDEVELYEVVQAIAIYKGPAPEDTHLIYQNGFLESNWVWKYVKIGPPPPWYSIPYPAPTLRLEMWGKHVRNYFCIDGDVELTKKHPWLRPMQPEFVIECSQATHHERLEAALFLREWARDKIPPDELRLLLPTL